MKNLNRIILLLLTVMVFTACEKEEKQPYKTDNLISLAYITPASEGNIYMEYKNPLIFNIMDVATEYQFGVAYDVFVQKNYRPLQATIKIIPETSTATLGTDYTISGDFNMNFTDDNGFIREFKIEVLPTGATQQKEINLILDYGCETDFPVVKRTHNTLKIILKPKA